jgi:hypothetical protein
MHDPVWRRPMKSKEIGSMLKKVVKPLPNKCYSQGGVQSKEGGKKKRKGAGSKRLLTSSICQKSKSQCFPLSISLSHPQSTPRDFLEQFSGGSINSQWNSALLEARCHSLIQVLEIRKNLRT